LLIYFSWLRKSNLAHPRKSVIPIEAEQTEFSRKYAVELQYLRNRPPDVYVREPNLTDLADKRKLPHVYDQEKQQLCLYLPGCGYWTPDKPLASTVMLWASLWLFHFEVWLVTDVFHGQGVHPSSTKNKPAFANSTVVNQGLY